MGLRCEVVLACNRIHKLNHNLLNVSGVCEE